jgi:hypothetical protein
MMAELVLCDNEYLRWPMNDSRRQKVAHADAYYARPFLTRHVDLDIDFGQASRPVLITQLLSSCLRKTDGKGYYSDDEIWHWSLKDRLQALLVIVVATQGQRLRLQVRCVQPGCRELMEIELDLADFSQSGQPTTLSFQPTPETELQLRLPNGCDQLYWLSNNGAVDNSFAKMAATLVTQVNGETPPEGWQVPDAWLDLIGAELEQHDTLMTIEIETTCPACLQNMQLDLDIEKHLLSFLAGEQKRLLNQIHQLASAYHWSETDIVALTCQRRHYYTTRINEG